MAQTHAAFFVPQPASKVKNRGPTAFTAFGLEFQDGEEGGDEK
jgi:hypothetical protein